jgi:HD superfamily phosphohydrolase
MKQIADPVHGSIVVDELASRLIGTQAFQRLRNVKQLGLAHLVFPAADYSRFAHSIGVYHVTGRLLDALLARNVQIAPREQQRYKLAALLHDVGHYPFSHAMEHALKDHFSATSLLAGGGEGPVDPDRSKSLNHEETGQEVIEGDTEIAAILGEAGFEPAEVYRIFRRAEVLWVL